MNGAAREDVGQGTLTTHLVGRLSGALWIGSGFLATVAGAVLGFHPGASRPGMVGVGVGWVAIGITVWRVPWARYRRSATLWLVPVALGMITLYNGFTANDAFVYSTFFLVVFVWLGPADDLSSWAPRIRNIA